MIYDFSNNFLLVEMYVYIFTFNECFDVMLQLSFPTIFKVFNETLWKSSKFHLPTVLLCGNIDTVCKFATLKHGQTLATVAFDVPVFICRCFLPFEICFDNFISQVHFLSTRLIWATQKAI